VPFLQVEKGAVKRSSVYMNAAIPIEPALNTELSFRQKGLTVGDGGCHCDPIRLVRASSILMRVGGGELP
jgi:hypothetical protein